MRVVSRCQSLPFVLLLPTVEKKKEIGNFRYAEGCGTCFYGVGISDLKLKNISASLFVNPQISHLKILGCKLI